MYIFINMSKVVINSLGLKSESGAIKLGMKCYLKQPRVWYQVLHICFLSQRGRQQIGK